MASKKAGLYFNGTDRFLKTNGASAFGPAGSAATGMHNTHTHFILNPITPWYYFPSMTGYGRRSAAEQNAADAEARVREAEANTKLKGMGLNNANQSPVLAVVIFLAAIVGAVVGVTLALKKMPKQFTNLFSNRKKISSLSKIFFGVLLAGLVAFIGVHWGLFYFSAFISASAAKIVGGVLGGMTGLGLGVYFGKYLNKLANWLIRSDGYTNSDPHSLSSSAKSSLVEKYNITAETAETMMSYLTNKVILHRQKGSSPTVIQHYKDMRKAFKSGDLFIEHLDYFNDELKSIASEHKGQANIRTADSDLVKIDWEALNLITKNVNARGLARNTPHSPEMLAKLQKQEEEGMVNPDLYKPKAPYTASFDSTLSSIAANDGVAIGNNFHSAASFSL